MNVRLCALIVEDELFVALDLEDAMVEMGFYVCGVAATQDRAFSSVNVQLHNLALGLNPR